MKAGKVAADVGKGLLAGLLGTFAITTSQTVEMGIRKRKPSSAPAEAAGKVLGVKPVTYSDKKKFGNIVHFGYGTTWGGVYGLLIALGLPRPMATVTHFALVQGTAMVMLPGLKVAPPVAEWGVTEIAIEALHHAVYSTATAAAYARLDADDSDTTKS